MCSGDALDDRQAQTDTGLVAANARGSPPERFGQRRYQLRAQPFTAVLDAQLDELGARRCGDLHGATIGEVVNDGIVHEVRHHLQEQRG